MFTVPHWSVLIVDDDADIHAVSELALKREKVCGVPIKLHHANSAKEAMKMLSDEQFRGGIAVAFIDVVMENDKAGLDLCKHIRDELKLPATQLIIRTGQAGLAPPREVVDTCNISSYVTKHEADPERLYALTKQGIYSFFSLRQSLMLAFLADLMRAKATTPNAAFACIEECLRGVGAAYTNATYNVGIEVGNHYIGAGAFAQRAEFDKAKAECLKKGELDSKVWSGVSMRLPNPVARVGNNVLTQAKSVRDGRMATLIARDATIPEGLEGVYGPLWRLFLGNLAELAAA